MRATFRDGCKEPRQRVSPLPTAEEKSPPPFAAQGKRKAAATTAKLLARARRRDFRGKSPRVLSILRGSSKLPPPKEQKRKSFPQALSCGERAEAH